MAWVVGKVGGTAQADVGSKGVGCSEGGLGERRHRDFLLRQPESAGAVFSGCLCIPNKAA